MRPADAALPIHARREYAHLFPYEGRVPDDVLAVSRALHDALGWKHECACPELGDHYCPSDCCNASRHEYEARRLIDMLRDDGWSVTR
jgi:hypothetical protein